MIRIRPAVLLAVVVLLLGLLAGCGSANGGPLVNVTANGGPQFAIAWDAASLGQSGDFASYVVNRAHDPVTLVSATLIPIPGRPHGRLVHLAIGLHHDSVAADRGWPPHQVPVGPFRGARLPHGQTNIIFGFVAPASGVWFAAGIKITYRYHGSTHTVSAWSAAVQCVART